MPRRPSRRFLPPLAALAVAVGLLGAAGAAALQDPAGEAARTRAATSTARSSVEQMLSYSYQTIDAQAAQIETLLTGDFRKEFATAMDQDIKPLAVKNKTVVQARVSDIAVMDASESQVTVLAFVNQAKVGADEKQAAIDQNRVIATLTNVAGRWLISEVKAF